MVALHLAGYTCDQIEFFHPSDMTLDRFYELSSNFGGTGRYGLSERLTVYALLALSAVTLVSFIVHERKQSHPPLDLGLLGYVKLREE